MKPVVSCTAVTILEQYFSTDVGEYFERKFVSVQHDLKLFHYQQNTKNKQTHTHIHTLTHSHTHIHTLTHTLTHIHTLTLTHSHTHSYTHTFTHSHIHTHTFTHSHSHILTLTHSHTHTHTHTLRIRNKYSFPAATTLQ